MRDKSSGSLFGDVFESFRGKVLVAIVFLDGFENTQE